MTDTAYSMKNSGLVSAAHRGFRRVAQARPQYYPYYRRNSRRLRLLRDKHNGQRCFIIGTGPSLNSTNLDLLKGEIVFGVNTLYRGLPQFGIGCSYYAVSDAVIWKTHHQGISRLASTLFLSDEAGREYLSNRKYYRSLLDSEPYLVRNLGPMWTSGWNTKDLSRGAYLGYTVITDICLQAAYYMGFGQVYLLGCDSDYSGMHRFDGLETEAKGGGAIGEWQNVFASYEICKKVFEEDGREIINATAGGKLEVFRRMRLEDVVRSTQDT